MGRRCDSRDSRSRRDTGRSRGYRSASREYSRRRASPEPRRSPPRRSPPRRSRSPRPRRSAISGSPDRGRRTPPRSPAAEARGREASQGRREGERPEGEPKAAGGPERPGGPGAEVGKGEVVAAQKRHGMETWRAEIHLQRPGARSSGSSFLVRGPLRPREKEAYEDVKVLEQAAREAGIENAAKAVREAVKRLQKEMDARGEAAWSKEMG